MLLMSGKDGSCAGFLVFKPKNRRLVGVDILVVKKELRGLGLGRLMYGCFEAGCEDGTAIYIERVTELGRKFFARCGFELDVDYYKVLAEENRVAEPLKQGGL